MAILYNLNSREPLRDERPLTARTGNDASGINTLTSQHHSIHDAGMRTTLTLDADVAALLKRVMARQQRSLKEVVNDALRESLMKHASPRPEPARFETRGVDLGRCLVPSLDNIAEVLALAEGEDYK